MAAKHKFVLSVGRLKQCQTDERRFLQIKTATAIGCKVVVQQLFLRFAGAVAPIVLLDGKVHAAMNDLDRTIEVLP
jgi:hypothetical protein